MRRALAWFGPLLLLGIRVWASDTNPTDFPETAHILGICKHHTRGGTTSSYDYETGKWTHGHYSGSTQRETEMRIGNTIYKVSKVCKEVEVGKDYPAKNDKKKVHLLLPDGKTCDAAIEEVHEAQ